LGARAAYRPIEALSFKGSFHLGQGRTPKISPNFFKKNVFAPKLISQELGTFLHTTGKVSQDSLIFGTSFKRFGGTTRGKGARQLSTSCWGNPFLHVEFPFTEISHQGALAFRITFFGRAISLNN